MSPIICVGTALVYACLQPPPSPHLRGEPSLAVVQCAAPQTYADMLGEIILSPVPPCPYPGPKP